MTTLRELRTEHCPWWAVPVRAAQIARGWSRRWAV